MGEVYAATHELMDREAVVKVLLPEMSVNQAMVKRFFHEAQAAAQIQHPGIVEVFDFGYAEDGRAYLVMEMLRGETLNDRLHRASALSIEQAVLVIRQLAGAVGAAHELGIVHRDLKPDNIFIVPDPEVHGGERVKVLDFGLAKLAVRNPGSLATMSGAVFGTPAYMAPEQCYDAATVDHRADIYSIGCIFYKCLCGAPPFGTGGLDVLAAHLRDPVVPPRQIRSSVPPHIDALILRLLEKQPERRVQSCDELVAALRAVDADRARSVVALSPAAEPALPAPALDPAHTRAPARLHTPAASLRAADEITLMQAPPSGNAGLLVGEDGQGVAPATDRDSRDDFLSLDDDDIDELPRHSSLMGGAGQMFSIEPTPPGRKWPLWLALAGVATASSAAAVVLLASPKHTERESPTHTAASPELRKQAALPSSTDIETFDAHLTRAEKAIEAEQWSDALEALEQAHALSLGDLHRKERADALQRRAQQELQSQLAFERFRTAVATNEVEAVIRHYASISTGSIYIAKATPAYEAVRGKWLDGILVEARHLAGEGECDKLAPLLAEADRVFPDARTEFAGLPEECAANHARPRSSRRRSKTSRSNETPDTDAKQSPVDQADPLPHIRQAIKQSQYPRALELCEQASSGTEKHLEIMTICGLAACNTKNANLARRYHAMLPAARKGYVLQTCLKQGIDLGTDRSVDAVDTLR